MISVAAQTVQKKQGLLFLRRTDPVPLQGVFIESKLIIDSSLSYNILQCKQRTGVLIPLYFIFRKDRKYEQLLRSAVRIENSYQLRTESSPDINNDQLLYVMSVEISYGQSITFENSNMNSEAYSTPLTFKGQIIILNSTDQPRDWGLLQDLKIIPLPNY
jgi:hypothetical protein